jgi:hypothetical protein
MNVTSSVSYTVAILCIVIFVLAVVQVLMIIEFFAIGSRIHKILELLRLETAQDWGVERLCEHCAMSIPPRAWVCFRCSRDVRRWSDADLENAPRR